jgi:alkylhydroperoxidase family enzyme
LRSSVPARRRALTEAEYDSLRQHGFVEAEIVELIAMSALAVYANIIADATAMEPDEMFATISGATSDA